MDKTKIQKIIYNHNLNPDNLIEVKDDEIFIKDGDIIYKLDNKGNKMNLNESCKVNNVKDDKVNIKKPRGWALKKEFIDSEGNIYHKGKLQL